MIPRRILDYLESRAAKYEIRRHGRAVSAQELAASLDITGYCVAKTVIVDADGRQWMAVLPAPELVDEGRLAEALGAKRLRLSSEQEFLHLFPDCEGGAEPPFGRLYGLPVIVDSCLSEEERLAFRAGSHEEAIEMDFATYAELEKPQVADFAISPAPRVEAAQPEARI